LLQIDRRIFTHFDYLTPLLILPLISISYFLILESNTTLANKQIIYFGIGFMAFVFIFITPIRKIEWLIPVFFWVSMLLLVSVDFFGVAKLGARRWLEIPFVHFTIQPSEIAKPAFILMLAYIIKNNPPPEEGYGWRDFFKISFYILLPFILIAKEPDLGTAMVLFLIGFGVLFVMGVHKHIWITLILIFSISSPLLYGSLHDYQKKRIKDFLSEKPSYHVKQSIITIGSGGVSGKPKDEATQTHFKFLPISTSDFIFAYLAERFGFIGTSIVISLYAALILHLLSFFKKLKEDYFSQTVVVAVALMIFIYMSVNILMTMGLAPVVGIPLPFFSYGGSSFITFMTLFGLIEHLITFRYDFTNSFIKYNKYS